MTLGEKLRQARLDRGLSQKQAAGDQITRNMLSLVEADRARPSMKTLTYLAQLYGLPVSWFADDGAEEAPALDAAREAYRQQRFQLCLDLTQRLEDTDEGLLLQALSALELAEAALDTGACHQAERLARTALAANRGLYAQPALRDQALALYARSLLAREGHSAASDLAGFGGGALPPQR